jgi:hypothetical protein
VSPADPAGSGRSALTRTDRPHNDLRAIDEDLRAVLMLQRRVHQRCDVQERAGRVTHENRHPVCVNVPITAVVRHVTLS